MISYLSTGTTNGWSAQLEMSLITLVISGEISAPVQTGPGAHPASYTMGTGVFSGAKAAVVWR